MAVDAMQAHAIVVQSAASITPSTEMCLCCVGCQHPSQYCELPTFRQERVGICSGTKEEYREESHICHLATGSATAGIEDV